MRRIQRGWQAAGVLGLVLLVVPTAAVQASDPAGAGVATAVTGQVTVSHAASPGPQPLHFKDSVFLRDRISTAAQSLARLLLGKKALLTVRELSELELTDQAGNSTIQLAWGKIAIGVARQRMRPGEIVEIRTQNVVAAIRGTVVVAETLSPPGAANPVTRMHVLSGYIDVTTPGNPGAPPLRMVAPSSVTVTGNTMDNPVPLDAAARAALLSDLRPAQPQHADPLAALAAGEQSRAAALGNVITGEGSGSSEPFDLHEFPANPTDAENTIGRSPITPPSTDGDHHGGNGGGALPGGGSKLPFIYSSQTATISGDLYQVPPPSSLKLATDLLRSSDSTLNIGGDILQVKGSLSSSTALPFMSLNGGASAAPTTAQTATLLRNGTLSLTGPLLDAVNSTVTFMGPALLAALAKSSLTGKGSSPFVSFTGGSLTLGAGTSGVSLDAGSTAALAGPLFSASGTPITGSSDFVSVKSATLTGTTVSPLVGLTGGTLFLGGTTGSAAPLVSLTGGTSEIATDGSIFHLTGTATAVDAVSGLRVGTEEPIQYSGGLLDMNAATVTTQRAVTVDKALLQASAPLLNLRGGAQLTVNGDAIDLTSKAKVTSTGPYVALDRSRVIVNDGALIKVAGGSFLQAGGNLVNLANGSTLTINNGVLLSVSGGSIVNISGALIAFGGLGGNTVNVSNSLAFVNIGGIPVALTDGALAANVKISGTPIKNPSLGTITPSKALIQVNGAASKLTISGF